MLNSRRFMWSSRKAMRSLGGEAERVQPQGSLQFSGPRRIQPQGSPQFRVFQNLKIRTRSLYRRLLHLRCRGEDKGLCYYCDEKWNPGHKCKVPKSYIMEGMEFSKEERQENYLEQTVGEDLYLSRDL